MKNPQEHWQQCLHKLREELSPNQFNTWILPLQPRIISGEDQLVLLAPNNYVLEKVKKRFLSRIIEISNELLDASDLTNKSFVIDMVVGSALQKITKIKNVSDGCRNTDTKSVDKTEEKIKVKQAENTENTSDNSTGNSGSGADGNDTTNSRAMSSFTDDNNSLLLQEFVSRNYLNPAFTFTNFVEGKSNQLARASAIQVASNVGKIYNPMFIYGGVGLGKTHLMHAIGNMIKERDPKAKVLYLHSERFVSDMIRALQRNAINDFKKFYRGLDALLIDDIQFFAGKERSQEEFFHTFNALFESQQQIVLTCDRYPKEIAGVEERLKSRFGWGLIVSIEPPELETRMAILLNKAEQSKVILPQEVVFFIAKHIQSNVRELEGALKRVIANAYFTGKPITLEFAKEALKDLLSMRARSVTIENIQKIVAEYFKIRLFDLTSKDRSRHLARPRQMAMVLAKELTGHSLPEIATAFGGRDHTTVIHAYKKIKELMLSDVKLIEDYRNLMRILSV